uniref:Very-long-chain (3R)-3-hydroxyacyl-CoA dehydratase n=1 Tax=Parastrongyloides trichosuri TaxID=131310 RepID=A0A0N4Z7Y0_PARTI
MGSLQKISGTFDLSQDEKKIEENNAPDDNLDNRFFDSSDYRCCFNLFHAKIVTFVFCTLVLHEIVLGGIYLLGRDEFAKGDWTVVGVFIIRLLQLPPVTIAYYSLWRCNPYLIIPFGVSQVCIGSFADIFTLLKILKELDAENSILLPFEGVFEIFNILIPLVIYIFLAICLIWVLYRCHIYFIARRLHQRERNMYRSKKDSLPKNENKVNEEAYMLER